MSMVYDPVSREFRPRETRGEKPSPVDLTQLPVDEPVRKPSVEGEPPRARRRTSMRHRRRLREMIFYVLFVLLSGGLIWATVWAWSLSRHHSVPSQDRSPVSRFWQSTTE